MLLCSKGNVLPWQNKLRFFFNHEERLAYFYFLVHYELLLNNSRKFDLFLQLQDIVSEQFEVELDKITLDSNLGDDFGADQSDGLSFICELEEYFDIEIPDEQCFGIKDIFFSFSISFKNCFEETN